MIKIPKEMIIEKIKEKTNLTESEINTKIKEKLNQLSGLISEEGAAHIVANQLGVKLLEETGRLQIKNVLPGMRKVDILGRVVRVYDVKEFETEKRKGKLGSFLIGDDTGIIRVVCWNDKADLISKLKENMLIQIESAYARENRNGKREIHIADRGNIIFNPKGGEDIKEVKSQAKRKKISDLTEKEDNVEILGTIVQVFDPRFFEICPECGKRARGKEDGFYCDVHSKINPNYAYVLNLFVDDGTENIRVVLWKNQVQKLLSETHENLVQMRDTPFDEIKNELLGSVVKFVGRTTKNEMFDRIEFIAQLVFPDVDPDKEIERINNEIKDKEEVPAEDASGEEVEDIQIESKQDNIEQEEIMEPADEVKEIEEPAAELLAEKSSKTTQEIRAEENFSEDTEDNIQEKPNDPVYEKTTETAEVTPGESQDSEISISSEEEQDIPENQDDEEIISLDDLDSL
ncbi:hypothetical protein JXB41_08195 [Candidatus Woesearchaeota archaeon]|nr:hypothetical protein [Candidatus Woesearchaeota archaeon]